MRKLGPTSPETQFHADVWEFSAELVSKGNVFNWRANVLLLQDGSAQLRSRYSCFCKNALSPGGALRWVTGRRLKQSHLKRGQAGGGGEEAGRGAGCGSALPPSSQTKKKNPFKII